MIYTFDFGDAFGIDDFSIGIMENASELASILPTPFLSKFTSHGIEYHGHPVIRIADRAFECCTTIESITIWADITEIGDYAFSGCSGLRRINIPSSTKRIGDYAFQGCMVLEDVTFWNAGSIGEYSFAGCTALTNVSIPSDTKIVGAHAFDG